MLSDAKLRSLRPKEKAYKVYADRGLYIVVNPNGSRRWRFKYKYDGREREISLGVYRDVTLQYAREQLQEAR
ncbi:MAG: Arm DNA-binding domain-containing protein [Steroidobacteraceae bacterium]